MFYLLGTDGHSIFKLFENNQDRRFFPLVDQPDKAVEMLSNDGYSIRAFNNDTYEFDSNGKVITLATLSEDKKDRQATLLEHNNNMSELFYNLCKKYHNVVLVYSGKLNPWTKKSELSNNHNLVTRHLMAAESEPFILKDPKTGKALVYAANYPTLTVNNETFPVEGTNTEVNNNYFLSVNLSTCIK